MSSINVNHLHELITKFITRQISGDTFEKFYSDSYDFEDIAMEQSSLSYFSSIRQLLEYFSSSEKDLKEYSDYYIDENQLRNKILIIKDSIGLTS